MSHPARVSLRAPPHLPFIQGFPGIPGGPSRRPPGVHGTVEVRVGAVPIKAKWVRVEIRKHETIPPGFKLAGGSDERTTWEHVGEIETLWQSSTPGKEFDVLETADFKFFIPLAENIPPSVTMMKDSGIRYELVAAVCYKQKGGMFKKELSSVIKTTEDLRITKHELNSAWPLYNQPDSFNASAANGQVNLNVQRPWSAFGPNDRILLTAVLRSNQPKPFRVKGFECTLLEVVTVTQVTSTADKRKSKKGPAPTTKSRTVATARYPIDETIGKGGEKSARIDIPMTADKLLVTVRNGRSIEVGYELEVKAVCESIPEVVVRGIKYIVGPFSRSHAQQAVRDIGHFPPLCPAPPAPHSSNPPSSRPGSPTNTQNRASPPTQSPSRTFTPNSGSRDLGQPDFPPGFSGHPLSRPPVQGFNPTPMNDRRKSSSTITTTTTTLTHDFGPSGGYQQGGRPYSTMPGPSQRNSMPVPSPYQNGNLLRTPSYGSSVNTPPSPQVESSPSSNQYGQYNGEQDDYKSKRYSTMTAGTFGMRDRDQLESLAEYDQSTSSAPSSNGARTPRPPASASGDSTRGPPSAWLPAEQEKQRLYTEARARAANTQFQTGASMQDIGMDAPPDYDTPSRHTQVPLVGSSSSASAAVPAVVLTAAEEKEQQRKRYEEAQNRSSAAGSSNGASGSGAPPSSSQATYLTAAEEKEVQKRRFEEAQARVGGTATPNTAADSPAGGMPWTHLSAAEEKDLQRKRYEEAARRAGGTVGEVGSVSSRAASPAPSSMMTGAPSPIPGEQPIPYDAVFPGARGSSRTQQPSSPLASGRNTPSAPRQTELSDKEAMNRYVFAKDRRNSRIVSNPSASSSTPASPPSQRPMSGSAASSAGPSNSMALSNDEAMKRYYDQQARSDRSVASPVAKGQEAPPPFASGSGSGSGSSRPMSNAPPVPIVDEKAQMKRYYEALDKVNNAQLGGQANGVASGSRPVSQYTSPTRNSDPPPPIDAPAASSSGKPAAYMSAADEKEQMRKRYEQATSAVSRTQNPNSPQANGASSSSFAPAPTSPTPAHAVKPYMSAAEEKEQMRKRFEDATAAVNRKSTQPPLMSPQPYDSPPLSAAAASGSSSRAPAPYLSAADEKEQMRKRYEEATSAVGRSSTQPTAANPGPPPPQSPPGPSGSSSSKSPAPYLSAAEEKEQMRRRFEDATAAVNRKSTQPEMPRRDSVIPPQSASGPSSSSSPIKPPPTGYLSAEQEKEQMRQRFESAQAAVNRSSMSPPPRALTSPAPAPAPTRQATAPMPSLSAMGRRTSSIPPPDPNAPPPPLPARPPAEYINLLSPVDEGERPPWSNSFAMPGQPSGSGSSGR